MQTFVRYLNQYSMTPINDKALVKCSKSILIDVRPEKVWHVLTDINSWPAWQAEITQAKINGALQPGTSFDWTTGGTKIRSLLHTVDPHQSFGWTGQVMGIFAIHNWRISEEDGKTKVLVEESMEGLLAWVFSRYFNKSLAKGMMAWLLALKNTSEHLGRSSPLL